MDRDICCCVVSNSEWLEIPKCLSTGNLVNKLWYICVQCSIMQLLKKMTEGAVSVLILKYLHDTYYDEESKGQKRI